MFLRSYLQVFIRPILEFLPTFVRAEKVFLSRKLGTELGFPLIDCRSTNWVGCHDSSCRWGFCSFNLHLTAMSFPFSAFSQVTDPVHLLRQAISPEQNHRKILSTPVHLIPTGLPSLARCIHHAP